MPRIPAICNECQALFPSLVNLTAENANLQGLVAGPCPRCGGDGKIIDGVYSALQNTIPILLKHSTRNSRTRLARIFDEGRDQKLTRGEIVDRIKNETPRLKGIAKYLPKDCLQLCAVLVVLGGAIAFVHGIYRDKPDTKHQPTPLVIEHYIDNSVNLLYVQQQGDPKQGNR